MTEFPQPFVQTDNLRDHVFPIMEIDTSGAQNTLKRFLGTGFFIGHQSMALTAAHVVKGVDGTIVALLADGHGWRAFLIQEFEIHHTEDVAIMSIAPPSGETQWSAFTTFSARPIRSSAKYHLWGYPQDAAYELVKDGMASVRPDLVYSEGHVRRRVTSVPLPKIMGSRFLELSGVAGGGCSGSPVLDRAPGNHWDLVGVYVGERLDDRSTSVGYASRLEEMADWTPSITGRTLRAEFVSEG